MQIVICFSRSTGIVKKCECFGICGCRRCRNSKNDFFDILNKFSFLGRSISVQYAGLLEKHGILSTDGTPQKRKFVQNIKEIVFLSQNACNEAQPTYRFFKCVATLKIINLEFIGIRKQKTESEVDELLGLLNDDNILKRTNSIYINIFYL